jgi:hypothetical protein
MYLALRLAAIEHHVETVAPCPVIFDDVLINSDDERASAALRVLGDLQHALRYSFSHTTGIWQISEARLGPRSSSLNLKRPFVRIPTM